MAMQHSQFTRPIVTMKVAPGGTYNLPDGCSSVDFNNQGSDNAGIPGTITGQNVRGLTSVPVDIPVGKPYTLEFNPTGYASNAVVGFIVIDNPGGNDGDIDMVIKF